MLLSCKRVFQTHTHYTLRFSSLSHPGPVDNPARIFYHEAVAALSHIRQRLFRSGLRTPQKFHFVLALVMLALASSSASAPPAWTTVVDGIDYRSFVLPGPVRAYVARMDLDRQNLILDSSLARGALDAGFETVSGMADRYDQALNAWGGSWGGRSKVVVAINGSFYDLETSEPAGGVISGGWYVKKFDDLAGLSGLSFKQDRSLFSGGCVFHPAENQRMTNLATGYGVEIDDINNVSPNEEIILFSTAGRPFSPGGPGRVEVVVELLRPAGVLPNSRSIPGTVRQVRAGLGPAPILFNQVVLSSWSEPAAQALLGFSPGDRVGVTLDLAHLQQDCRSPNDDTWTKTYASLASDLTFLRDGQVIETDNRGALLRNPRTAICYNQDYVYFVVVDGRDDAHSVGMTLPELGSFCRDKLAASWGVNYDGGGSSTMWINGIVQNRPSDGRERGVANGWMMLALEPAVYSESLSVGSAVRARFPTNVLLGPGTNYVAMASVAGGARGTILPQMNNLNGVLAKDTHWWMVDFGGVAGWVDELALEAIPDSSADLLLQGLLERLLPTN